MKKTIAIFDSHDEAIDGVEALTGAGINPRRLSIIGKADLVDDKIQVKSNRALVAAPTVAGTVLGTSVGLLSGIGLFAIPGLGFLFGAGAIVGALAGFDVGLIAGGVTTMLVDLGVKEDHVKYEQHLKEGKFLLFMDGEEPEIAIAEKVLEGKHLGMVTH